MVSICRLTSRRSWVKLLGGWEESDLLCSQFPLQSKTILRPFFQCNDEDLDLLGAANWSSEEDGSNPRTFPCLLLCDQ